MHGMQFNLGDFSYHLIRITFSYRYEDDRRSYMLSQHMILTDNYNLTEIYSPTQELCCETDTKMLYSCDVMYIHDVSCWGII